jgi:glutathione synthase/RimK-type ligase-like ATP-grasp enzyme
MKTILAIGDDIDWESFLKFKRKANFFKKKNIKLQTIDYNSILKGKLKVIRSKEILIALFFPLKYWNTKIENSFVKGRVYGDKKCAEMFYEYMDQIKEKIEKKYHNKNLTYMNSFEAVKVDRDKELTKSIIKKAVPVPKSYPTRKYKDIIQLLNKGKKLYIKVNFGAMGKGITKLEKNKWLTNFIFRNKSIISRKGDYGWKFKDITNNPTFLKELLKKDIIIEEAINPRIIKGKKFDIRYYVVYGKIKYQIIRSTSIDNVVTNITQGGSKEKKSFMGKLPKKIIKQAQKNAINAAKALNLNLAGVDVMISKKGIAKVIEAQSFPGFPASKHNFSKKLAMEILRRWK